ncbi:hypothetical protein GCM10025868_34070 [Angustibacter aerolatus]|uniref:Pilus assembly protein n=1 Tax=Angustibacter aerolatus TaxID=1162965 RepID=A0ABQ6JMT9_9ACTN|nr:hypothetical protein GCM10025868_34070 [Angustibacter aerolatus]
MGMAFLLLLMVLFVIQVAAVTYTMAQANGAARAAARASTLGQSGQSAARNAVSRLAAPGGDRCTRALDGAAHGAARRPPDADDDHRAQRHHAADRARDRRLTWDSSTATR